MTDKQLSKLNNTLLDLADHLYTELALPGNYMNVTEAVLQIGKEIQKSREQSDQNSRRLIEKLQNLDHSLKYLRLSIDTAKQDELSG